MEINEQRAQMLMIAGVVALEIKLVFVPTTCIVGFKKLNSCERDVTT
jgi:hypothetical protein